MTTTTTTKAATTPSSLLFSMSDTNDRNESEFRRHQDQLDNNTMMLTESQTNANANNKNNNNNNPYQIRHSGRVLVRGKFRRVWRPRHLEVLDQGLVRYYEVPPPTPAGTLDAFVDSSTMVETDHNILVDYEDDQYHSKIPKCQLWIHSSRIIDVTTLRDMHVGLPRGSYGFLFHAHRMDEDDYDDDADVTLRDNIQLLTMGQACHGNTNLATPRDFLCAVNSLEEAQSWVIALQWAASMGRESSFTAAGSSSLTYTMRSRSGTIESKDGSWQQEDTVSLSSSFTNLQQQQQQQQQQLPLSDKQDSSTPATTTPTTTTTTTTINISKQQSTAGTKRTAKRSAASDNVGKMVVTKVVGCKLVRLEAWKWDIAYQVQVLLVMPSTQHRQVQEWSVFRTAQDLDHLLDKLKLSVSSSSTNSSSSSSSQLLEQQGERVGALPRLQQKQQKSLSSSSSSSSLATALPTAIKTLDFVLRSFCMEATVVNSSAMKRFLGLHSSSASSNKSKNASTSFWSHHSSTGVAIPPKRTILQQSIDQYVKQWLQQKPKGDDQNVTLKFQLLCMYLRLPQPATTYAGALLLSVWLASSTLPSLNRFIRKYQILPYVSLRVDVLLLSWVVAAGVGRILARTRGHHRDMATATTGRSSSVSNIHHKHNKSANNHVTSQGTPYKSTTGTTPSSSSPRGESDVRVDPSHSKSLLDEEQSEDSIETENEEDGDQVGEDEDLDEEEEGEEALLDSGSANQSTTEERTMFLLQKQDSRLSSPLPEYNKALHITKSCWSKPKDHIFNVRGPSYLTDRVKIPSGNSSFTCEGVDMWMTDNPERHIARHPSVLGGRLATSDKDIFLVNFLLPFGNFVSYFSIPPLEEFATPQLADVWTRFIHGDQQYRDARLKLLPVVVDGPWIVRAAVPGNSPALLGKVIPLQYFFTENKANGRSIYEVDVIITASSIAKGILSVVKGHAKALSIAFAFIVEASEEEELPETALASFQVNSLHIEDCPLLPDCNLDSF